jgi:hypothetical protein
LLLLARSGATFARLLVITVQGMFGRGKLAWVRTPRE